MRWSSNMVREFELPDVGEGVAEGELVSWLVEAGDAVSEDQPVAEVETDKALVEVPAPVDGTVRELHVEEGEVVPVGTVIISFDVEGETEGAAETETESEREQTSEPAGVDEPSEPRDATADAAGEPGATGADTEAVAPPDDRVFAPPRGSSYGPRTGDQPLEHPRKRPRRPDHRSRRAGRDWRRAR